MSQGFFYGSNHIKEVNSPLQKFMNKNNPFLTKKKDLQLINEINAASQRLEKKLKGINLSHSGISDYGQKYLGDKIANLKNHLGIYGYLLYLALRDENRELRNRVFVDYGGGSGILTLLAKEMGVGKVLYADIYDVSCNDACILAKATSNNADEYICGDINDLIKYAFHNNILIDVHCSFDVIEHIYDVPAYCLSLKSIPSNNLKIVIGSGANGHNLWIRKKLIKNQLQVEFEDREKVWGHKDRDSLKSYFTLRKEIVANYLPTLEPQKVEEIAHITRGLIKEDIERYLDEYITIGKITYEAAHPTNTCDPLTGNWCENLMNTKYIKGLLVKEGFHVDILGGRYSESGKPPKIYIKRIINIFIEFLREKSLGIAPYYIIHARLSKGKRAEG
jgi:SAM-dependent methyltransferase